MSNRRPKPAERAGPEPAIGNCPVSGKLRWEKRSQARAHVRDLRGRGDKRYADLGTYRCGDCDDWHVGHKRRDPS